MSTPLRLVTWNCAGALRKKLDLVDSLEADILVIQECENPALSTQSYRRWAANYLWLGDNKNRGLAVFAKRGRSLKLIRHRHRKNTEHLCRESGKRLSWQAKDLQSFLPCVIDQKFHLHAVWTKQQKPATFSYVGQLWKYVQSHRHSLKKDNTLICGDFNSNAIWDKKHSYWNHSSVVQDLAKLGIHSLYHRTTGEEHGQESRPTFYLYRHLDKPYHLDYVFLSRDLQNNAKFQLADRDTWLRHSDHLPLVLDLTPSTQECTL